ncbi:SRPBCC domain-containing protein [Paenibacillus sp. MER TA 81-3]|uniref:SRPBCC family protein n=1 Tax=Paenibacillus sp. MER TA 81-3 TaxID=2939573 RepID=UPI00203A4FFB|nr:SRPBCC domain-containing protein [Paenibacillus sp. MER TA 81-3]MCM3340560.1 SRPBCC domain-containing protein [Paenibacillus sp. MER TA 81-3]
MIEHNDTNEKELVITRMFDAPRELVFKAWTEPDHLEHWWGPKGFKMNVSKLELCPDGIFHYSQKSPDGHQMWGKFVYRDIVPPERLVFTNSFSDEEGSTVRAPFSPTWPLEILNTLTFAEHEGKTKLTIQGGPTNATEEERNTFEAMRDNIQQGFAGTFEQLADYLSKV